MNENAEKWVKALDSDKYEQTRDKLHRTTGGMDTFCCLGVACEVAIENGVDLPVVTDDSDLFGCVVYDGDRYALPPVVRDWLGLSDSIGTHFSTDELDEEEVDSLANLNDNGASFKEIAALINAEPGGLFA